MPVPGAADISVSREPAATGAHEDVYVTIRDAFKAARRQLQDVLRKRTGHVLKMPSGYWDRFVHRRRPSKP
jgi:hypothetical protein